MVRERRQSFTYTTGWRTLPIIVGNQLQVTLAILADADFECVYLTGGARQAGLLVATWSGLIQIQDSSAGREMFNVAVPFDAIAGTGRQPYPLQPPRRWQANSSIIITWTVPVVTATDVYVAFHGNKLYPEGAGPERNGA